MAWLFHVHQRPDERWVCRHGLEEIDDHGTPEQAVAHCLVLAAAKLPASVVLHRPGEAPERIEVPDRPGQT